MRISDWSSDVCSSDLQDPSDIQTLAAAYLDRRPRISRAMSGNDVDCSLAATLGQPADQLDAVFLRHDDIETNHLWSNADTEVAKLVCARRDGDFKADLLPDPTH